MLKRDRPVTAASRSIEAKPLPRAAISFLN